MLENIYKNKGGLNNNNSSISVSNHSVSNSGVSNGSLEDNINLFNNNNNNIDSTSLNSL